MKTFSEAVSDSIADTLASDDLSCEQIADLMSAQNALENYDAPHKSVIRTTSECIVAALLRLALRSCPFKPIFISKETK